MEYIHTCTQKTLVYNILSSERAEGSGVSEPQVKYVSPQPDGWEEGRTCHAVSCRVASPTHYQLSSSSPINSVDHYCFIAVLVGLARAQC